MHLGRDGDRVVALCPDTGTPLILCMLVMSFSSTFHVCLNGIKHRERDIVYVMLDIQHFKHRPGQGVSSSLS